MDGGDPKRLKDAVGNAKFLLTGNIDGDLLPDAELIPVKFKFTTIPITM